MKKFDGQLKHALCNSQLPLNWIKFLTSPQPAIIFGSGKQATIVYDFCTMFNKACFCLMTTSSTSRWDLLPQSEDLPLYIVNDFPSELNKKNFDLIIAVDPSHNRDIQNNLHKYGWSKIYTIDNWQYINTHTRELYYYSYFQNKGVEFIFHDGGKIYIKKSDTQNDFKIYYNINEIYNNTLLGDIKDIILPSVFDDYSIVSPYGPYEYKNVKLLPEDTVLCIGASIGMFACAAASKNCTVYAFEPNKMAFEFLRMNAKLYDNIHIESFAIYNDSKKMKMFSNTKFLSSLNITADTLKKEWAIYRSEIEVSSTTIDEYVRNKKIKNIDFIKSNSKHSECEMIQGARNTLATYGPKLALFALDQEVDLIVDAILQVNPRYVFERKWLKIFAWIP